MDPEVAYRDTLRNAGERITSPRLVIFRALIRHSPIATTRLTELAAKNGIDPATTYRTLKLLRQLGIANDVVAGGKRLVELGDTYHSHHHHFWCRRCGRLIDFDHPEVEAALTAAISASGAQMLSHHIEIQGLCASCRSKPATSPDQPSA